MVLYECNGWSSWAYRTKPPQKTSNEAFGVTSQKTKAFKIIVDTLDVQVDFFFEWYFRKDYCFRKGLDSTLSEDYTFNGRLDFQGMYSQTTSLKNCQQPPSPHLSDAPPIFLF